MILIAHERYATSYSGEDVKALYTKLFAENKYNHRVRPADDQSKTTEATLYANETTRPYVTAQAALEQRWPHMNEVWKPDIALRNSNLEHKELGVSSLNVRNYNSGEVYWSPFQVFESKCSMDITNFPFDYQTCYLKFQAWSYQITEVFLKCASSGTDLLFYEPNPGWDINNSSCTDGEHLALSQITFSITIRRKPLYFMLSVIFPILTLAILNICVFLLPTDCGEKAGFSISVFLAFAVFLTIVSSSLPQNSNSISLISVFLIIQTTCSTLTTVLALALLRISSFDDKVTIPRILVFFMRCLKCKSCSKPRRIESTITRTESRMSDETSTGDVEFSWKEVANFLDVVLFVIFACILVASSMGCFLTAMNSYPSDVQTERPTPGFE
ncbi:neuronal acetylcholine receptor subunit beta-2-like [Dreissena polymorpha]|uniref:neuronal acetylcholine receptor subunit beta-2-like n=1 Tax=Dreissena polymorpha TaxID=45954 RepID=UPI002264D3B6|nr:neuronal acetylcholine receptor subunit beta-2-like [Dreissena polymorpha]